MSLFETDEAPLWPPTVQSWSTVPIRYLLKEKITDGPHETPEFLDEGFPFLSVDGIQDGELTFDKCRFVSQEQHIEFRKKAAPRVGDILFGKAASTGKIARVKSDREFTIWSPLALLRPDLDKVIPGYLEYALKSPMGQAQVDTLKTTSTQSNISMEAIPRIRIPVPSLPLQKNISEFLNSETGRINDLIAAKVRLLALLAEKRRALITRAVTRGLDPDVPLRESGLPWLGEVPAHWKVTRLKFVADVQGGLALGKNYGAADTAEYPYLRVANVQDGYLDLSEITTVLVPENEAKSCLLQPGDVLMNEGGDADKLGRGCIWLGEIIPCLHQNHVFAVRPKFIRSEWLNAWTSTDTAKAYFESRAKQSTNLASISGTNIKELPLFVPPDEEQSAIVAHIAAETARLDALAAATGRSIALPKERRAALIAAAVTGRIDVRSQTMPSGLDQFLI